MPQALSQETITAIRTRRKTDQKVSDIARELGISTSSVLKYTPDLKKRRRPNITPAESLDIQERYTGGEDILDIARAFNTGKNTILRHTAKLERRCPRISPETIEAIRQRSRDGHKGAAIARELGISTSSVGNHTHTAKRPRHQNITPAEELDIQTRYTSREHIADIARALGISTTTVVSHTAKLERRCPRISPETIEAIRQRSRDGHKGAAIAREFGVSESTVSRHLKGKP